MIWYSVYIWSKNGELSEFMALEWGRYGKMMENDDSPWFTNVIQILIELVMLDQMTLANCESKCAQGLGSQCRFGPVVHLIYTIILSS